MTILRSNLILLSSLKPSSARLGGTELHRTHKPRKLCKAQGLRWEVQLSDKAEEIGGRFPEE